MNIFCLNTIDRVLRLTFTAAFARILGTYKKGDKFEKDQNFIKEIKRVRKFDRQINNF